MSVAFGSIGLSPVAVIAEFLMFMTCMGILVLAIPMGAAGQNIAFGVVALLCAATLIRRAITGSVKADWQEKWRSRVAPFAAYLAAYALFLVWGFVTTTLQPDALQRNLLGYVLGDLAPLLLPLLVALTFSVISSSQWQRLQRWVQCLVGILGLVALSQWVFGWQFFQGQVHFREHRAYGFYSHPLTFSYAMLLLAPLLMHWVRGGRRGFPVVGLVGATLTILASLSRTVQIVFLGQLMVFLRGRLHQRVRRIMVGGLVAFVAVLTLFDNPIRQRFVGTVNRTQDVQSDYPDDRLAFWHAHWHLIKARPVLGHGVHIPRDTLDAAYAQIGLADFTKKYGAHNAFLQVMAETGLIGLALFIGFWGLLIRQTLRLTAANSRIEGFTAAWIGFLLASLTQNAFQDSEVRGVFAIMLCWLVSAAPPPHDHSA